MARPALSDDREVGEKRARGNFCRYTHQNCTPLVGSLSVTADAAAGDGRECRRKNVEVTSWPLGFMQKNRLQSTSGDFRASITIGVANRRYHNLFFRLRRDQGAFGNAPFQNPSRNSPRNSLIFQRASCACSVFQNDLVLETANSGS